MADDSHDGSDAQGKDPNEEELREVRELLGEGAEGASPFSAGPAASALPKQNLDHDRYDGRLWREILDASAELSALRDDEEAPSTFPALLTDLFLSYFKAQPDLLPETAVEPRHRTANRPFVERTLDDPDTYRARVTTSLDVSASALSVLAAGERLLEEIKNRPSLSEFFDEVAKEPQASPPRPSPDEDDEGQDGAPRQTPEPEEGRDAPQDENPAGPDGQGGEAGGPEPPGPQPPRRDARRAVRAAANAGREEAENLAGALSGWGLSPADLKRVPLGERLRLLKALSAPEMRRLVDLVGKMRILARQKAKEKVRERRDEVHSIELSGDLGRLLPSELALLASPQEERSLVALGRLARGESLSWELRGKEKEKKGPLIAMIDCSGSMGEALAGSPHKKMEWATALALGLVDLSAGRGGLPRRASAVLFFNARVAHEVRFAPGERDARKLLDVATVRAGGGTSYEPAIERALEIARESDYAGADLVLVTDELCRVDEAFRASLLEEKERRGMRLFSVLIGHASSGELGRYSDHVWALTDLAGPASPMGVAGEVFGLI